MTALARLALVALALSALTGCVGLEGEYQARHVGEFLWLYTARDDEATARLVEQASDAGDAKAMVERAGQLRNTATHDIAEGIRLKQEAARLDRAAADKGDPEAEVNVGVLCLKKARSWRRFADECSDDAEAVRWFQRAMAQGNARALAYVGFMTEFGRGGLDKNPDQGIHPGIWRYDYAEADIFRRGTERGDAGGEVNLGFLYEHGWAGLPTREAEAARLYRLAADQGNAVGRTNLGVFYAIGRGAKQSDSEAVRLWSLAAQQDFAPAQLYFAAFFLAGRGKLASDDPAALAALRSVVARALRPNRCEHGWAVLGLASLYENGAAGLHRDLDEAIRLTTRLSVGYGDGGCNNEEEKAKLLTLNAKKHS